MFKKKTAWLVGFLMLILIVGIVGGCGTKDTTQEESKEDQVTKTLKIGVVQPLTGPLGMWGTALKNGGMLNIDRINNEGGVTVNGEKYLIEPIIMDDRGDPKETVSIIEKLIGTGIDIVFGPMSSSSALAAGPILQREKVVSINGAASTDASKWDYTFANQPDLAWTFDIIGTHVAKGLGLKKLALLTENSERALQTSDAIKASFIKSGGEVVAEEFFMPAEVDFYAELTKLKKANPDALFIGSSPDIQVLAITQAYELGLKPVMIVPGSASQEVIRDRVPKEKLEGIKWYDISNVDLIQLLALKDPRAELYLAEYQSKFGKDAPTAYSVVGYDNISFYAQALEISKSTSGSDVRDALANLGSPNNTWKWQPLRGYNPQNGKLFSEGHRVGLDQAVMQWNNVSQQWEFVEIIIPK